MTTKTLPLSDFLLARIAEDEYEANVCLDQYRRGDGGSAQRWIRQLAECEAKRQIVEFHKAWPVLVQRPAEFTHDMVSGDLNTVAVRMAQQMDWLTAQEFRERFGEEPPTAPMLAALAAVYSDHPDFREEWRA